jgi:hypothetical protein
MSQVSQANAFSGADRRRHRVYVTKNTEYHLRDGYCVAVRNRHTGEFLHGHLALRRRIQGGLRHFKNGALIPNPGEPMPGESLFFLTGGRDLVTSPLEGVERPAKELVQAYAEVGCAEDEDTFFSALSEQGDGNRDGDFFG